ncbi:MAG: hypothetical protein H6708_23730 [Kofleriaceae bacterium]|nr:hypothetical protein [Kofleriaceae bacterium]
MRWFLRPARACVVAAALLAGGAVAGCDKGDAPRVEVEPGVAAGDVREVAGAVAAIRGDARRILAVGDEVSGDDVIETGADGQVVIELRHNGARWSLGPSQSRRVAESAAWNAPRQAGGAGGAGERTAAAGREGERGRRHRGQRGRARSRAGAGGRGRGRAGGAGGAEADGDRRADAGRGSCDPVAHAAASSSAAAGEEAGRPPAQPRR